MPLATDAPPAAWAAVRGQPAAVSALRRAVERDEVAHAWLFAGPPEVGQVEAARALAAALNCERAAAGAGCGECSTCQRIGTGQHPACTDFLPRGQWHLVDAVREEWIPAATQTALEGRRKVLRIVAADRMNEAAQNAFLKVLEEPPASVVWILDVEDGGALLDTIASRCRRVDFVPWPLEAMEEEAAAAGVPAQRRRALARAALGSPRRLRELTDVEVEALVEARRAERDASARKKPTDSELDELRERLSAERARARHVAVLGELVERGPGVVVPLAKELDGWAQARVEVQKARADAEVERYEEYFRRDEQHVDWPPGFKRRLEQRHHRLEREERQRALAMLLDDLGAYLRDVIAAAAGAGEDALVNLDHLDAIRTDAGRVPVAALIAGLEAVAACREALAANGQPQLQLERMLLRLALPLYHPR